MKLIYASADAITVGAGVTHAAAAASTLIRQHARVLSLACSEVGSPQIREVGTLGGNVVNAQPAADAALALAALRSEALVRSRAGATWKPLPSLYDQPGYSNVDSASEILEAFRFPKLQSHSGSAYRRLGKCKSIALPVVCAAAVVWLDENCETFIDCSLAIGPVSPVLCLAEEAAAWIIGKPVSDEVILHAAQLARDCAHPRSSLLRCAADYREQMVEVTVKSVITDAVAGARMERSVGKQYLREDASNG